MNRNVSIVMVILVLVTIVGYLVWLRSKDAPAVSPRAEKQVEVVPAVSPTMIASPSATPSVKEATVGAEQKTSTPSSVKR